MRLLDWIRGEKSEIAPLSKSEHATVVDVQDTLRIIEAKRNFDLFMKQDVSPEQAADALHGVIAATDSFDFKLNVKGVRAMIERLKQRGFTESSTFNEFQDSERKGPYSATDSLNSLRAHCETMMQKNYVNAADSDEFNLSRVYIILEYQKK